MRRTVVAEAPGRVNLIGEHTDYNEGLVLPMPIRRTTRVRLSPRRDRRVRARSGEFPELVEFPLGSEEPGLGWGDHLMGVTALLSREGRAIHGFDLEVESDIPVGAGLSSSAAFLVALLRAIREAFPVVMDDVEIARFSQRVENEFVGARVGIMDPFVCSVGHAERALLLDCRSLGYREIRMPSSEWEWFVVHSGIVHRHATGGYNERRRECDESARLLGVGSLREISTEDLARAATVLPATLFKRVRHVVSENARVLEAVKSIEKGQLPQLRRIFMESQHSLSGDYDVSLPELDGLVGIALATPGVVAARMTGGGFGGSILVLARRGESEEAAQSIVDRYSNTFKRQGRIILIG